MSRAPFLYSFGKCILGPIFKLYYKPTIIGKENIPRDGSIIVAGNHIHLYDQCSVIVSTKRPLVYMAKKEYFDNKKTKWFFKSVGCIPVDRTKKDEDAVRHALDCLNDGGALGIFPEGTRNALKEERIKDIYNDYFGELKYEEFKTKLNEGKPKLSEIKYLLKLFDEERITKEELFEYIYTSDASLKKLVKKKVITEDEYFDALLLDFKFGAVSMASKTNSKIIPMVITGDYKFRSKNLIVQIGKPYEVGDKDLATANAELRSIFIDIMKDNYKRQNKR